MNEKKYLKQKIEQTLSEHSSGLSILEISSILEAHRHTVAKYIRELVSERKVYQRDVGNIKLHYSVRKLPEKEKLLLEKLRRQTK